MVVSAARPWPSSSASGNRPWLAATIFTSAGISARTSASTCARAASSMRSLLLSTTRSAAESWSSNSSCSGDSWSRFGSARRCASTASGRRRTGPTAAAGPSTTVTTASTVNTFAISGHWKACTSGLGSARPEVSMITAIDVVAARGQLNASRAGTLPARCSRGSRWPARTALRRALVAFVVAADAAAAQDLAVDAQLAELVDDDRRCACLRRGRGCGAAAWSCRCRGSR